MTRQPRPRSMMSFAPARRGASRDGAVVLARSALRLPPLGLPVLAQPVLPRSVLAFSVLALSFLAVAGPARAAGTPDAALPLAVPARPPVLLADPATGMAEMIRQLEKDPGLVVLMLETLPITQADIADVIRTMPLNFASLGFPEVTRRALDVLVSQKAMVLNARKEGIDKDPAVLRREKIATERIMSDEWLARKGNAAVTDQALHARYDHDIAGKPGPYEVRARLIVVPTADEAGALLGKAQAGIDFSDLARAYSKDGSAPQGGDLGYVPLEAVAPEIGPVMFALAPGQMTAYPMRSAAGYYLLRVEGRRQRATPSFEEARPVLERAIRAEAVQAAVGSVLDGIKMAPAPKKDEPAQK